VRPRGRRGGDAAGRPDPRGLRAGGVRRVITEDIPKRVAQDTAYKNASQNSDKDNARIEHDNALSRVLIDLMRDDTELFKQFCDNPSFKRWLGDMVFAETYRAPGSTHPT